MNGHPKGAAPQSRWLGRRLVHLDSCGSTNDEAFALLASEGPGAHGAVVTARAQTAGRGRQGRVWIHAPGEGLALSVALCPEGASAEGLALLPLAGAVAVARTLASACGLRTSLKWPNDLLAGDRKLCGTVAEARYAGERPWAVVLGIGVNVNQEPGAWQDALSGQATSVFAETGRRRNVEALAAGVIAELEPLVEAALGDPAEVISQAAPLWTHRAGEALSVISSVGTWTGTFEGVAPDGALRLRTPEGSVTVRYGDARRVRRTS